MNPESKKLYRSRENMRTRTPVLVVVMAFALLLTAGVRSTASTSPIAPWVGAWMPSGAPH